MPPFLRQVIDARLDRLPASARRFLSVTERSRVVLVPIEDVVYLKAELKYITIRTAEREYLLEESLTKLEGEFGSRFVRVHRNCLVARAAVRGFERSEEGGEAHWEVLLHGITERIAELGEEISEDFKGKELTMVCVLKGSFMFFADLIREIKLPDDRLWAQLHSARSVAAGHRVLSAS